MDTVNNSDLESGDGIRNRLPNKTLTEDETEDISLNKEDKPKRPKYYYDHSFSISAGGCAPWERFYLLLMDLRTLIMIPIRLLYAVFKMVTYFLSILYPTILILFIIWVFWFLITIYWPYLIKVIIVVFIPILNVLIILFNLFFIIFIVILSILIMIWNLIVPFIGMILYVVVNVVLTILADVFNIIGSVDWEPIISAIMNIIMVLVDIAMQILMVLIKVGMEILVALSNIISILVEVILTAIKIILPIVIWIIQILFKVLEPILKVIAIFFGGIASMFGRMAAGRNLLSITPSKAMFDTSEIPYYYEREPLWEPKNGYPPIDEVMDKDHKKFVENTLGLSNERDDYMYHMYNKAKEQAVNSRILNDDHHYDNLPESYNPVPKTDTFFEFVESQHGRRILQSWSKLETRSGLKFVDEEEEDELYDVPKGPNDVPESVLNDAAHTIAHTFYMTAKNFHADDIKLSSDITEKVFAEYRRKDNLGMKTLLREFARDYLHLHPKYEDTLSSLRYGASPEHPRDMHARFHEERRQADTIFMHNSGRHLMSNENDWEEVKKNYQSQKKIEDGKILIAQEAAYKKYHTDRMKVATVVYGATSKSLKHSMSLGVTPENILKHWDETLKYFGYIDIKHVHDEFVDAYGDAAGFLISFSSVSEHPFFKYFKKKDTSVEDSPYYHDWSTEQRKLIEARAKAAENSGGRKLLAVTQQNEDRDVAGAKESQESLGGFATLSTLNCFSSPKNPLCIPEIPPNFKFEIPQIKLSNKQKDTLEESILGCTPWNATWCIICLDRFYNTWHEFRFLISTIPLINYPIATITVLAPWTGIFFNWIFLVPKFKVGSLHQFVCFAYHLFDVFVVGVFVWFVYKIASFFWPEVVGFWYNLRAARVSDQPNYFQRKRLDDIDRYLLRMQTRGEIAGRIGAGVAIEDRSNMRRRVNTKSYEDRVGRYIPSPGIGTQNNVLVQHHHHHHHHSNYHDEEEEEIMYDQYLTIEERKRRNQQELLELLNQLHNDPKNASRHNARIYSLLKRFSDMHFNLEDNDHNPKYVAEISSKMIGHSIHDGARSTHEASNIPICSSSVQSYNNESSSTPSSSSSTSSSSSLYQNLQMTIN